MNMELTDMKTMCSYFAAFVMITIIQVVPSLAICVKIDLNANILNNQIVIDQAWSGSSVKYSGIAHGNNVFLAYYDKDRFLTTAKIDLLNKTICKARLNSRFEGWDAHNSVEIALDDAGLVHIAGNIHSSTLVYALSDDSYSIANMTLTKIVGRDEDSVTYPNFVRGQDGSLLFIYRNGKSGNGVWFVDSFEGGLWRRTSPVPIFADMWRNKPISAYFNKLSAQADGVFPVSIVWRLTPDVATNIALT